MSKTCSAVLALVASAFLIAPASAVVAKGSPDCAGGKPSVLVHLSGFKSATGTARVILYNNEGYLKKGGRLGREKIRVKSVSPVDVCLPVPGPGRYAVVVHHDVNGNGERDLNDGGGYSRNPSLSLTSLKAPFSKTGFTVGNSPQTVTIRLQYRKGLSVGPVA